MFIFFKLFKKNYDGGGGGGDYGVGGGGGGGGGGGEGEGLDERDVDEKNINKTKIPF